MILAIAALVAVTVSLVAVIHAHGAHLAGRQDRQSAAGTVDRLLDRFEVERGEWRDERQLLLTRIQDPTAGVASSLAYLPAPGDMDMDVER